MAQTLVNVIEIANISNQTTIINIKKVASSPFFTSSGQITISAQNKIVVESSRVDMKQLIAQANKNIIHLNQYRKSADIIASQSGSSGA